MKISIFILCLGALFLSSQAQEKPIAKIHYEFKHVNDTTQPEKFIRDELVTYLGKDGSYYTSYSGVRAQENISKQMSSASFDGNLVITKNTTASSESYFLDLANHKMELVTRVASKEFKLKDDFPVQDWEILEDTKEIGGYSCQKATTSFKGRNYTAWFASELPMSYGPWKLHGLPGLILSAYDDKNEVSFTYAGFDKMDQSTNVLIGVPESAIESTKKEVENLQKAFKDNPSAFIQAQRATRPGATTIIASGRSEGSTVTGSPARTSIQVGSGSSTSGAAMDVSKIKSMTVKADEDYKPSPITNNPIELSSK